MSSITQAKAEAQKLIKQYNKLQAEAKHADTEEAARKAAEAEKLVSQISSLQAAISKLQAKDREKEVVPKPQIPVKRPLNKSSATSQLLSPDELKRAEEEKTLLETRIARIEDAQKRTREQIDQLSRAKAELARLKNEAEQSVAKTQRANDEKLQQELAKLIKKKEEEQSKLKEELEAIREQARKDAELLKVQRDAARAMMEKQKQLGREELMSRRRRQLGKGLGWTVLVSVISLMVGVIMVLVTPWFDNIAAVGHLKESLRPKQVAESTPAAVTPTAPVKSKVEEEETQVPVTLIKSSGQYQDRLKSGGQGPLMVKLPEGTFLMGNKDSAPFPDERPQHKVALQGFSISKNEITFDDYDRFADVTERQLPPDNEWGRGNRPVINVNWDDAVAYAEWLTGETNHQYRLPSEREWEYAATAGTQTSYWWGNRLERGRANCVNCGSEWDSRQTAPVGSFAANPAGLNDVIGNVIEWTSSCYHANYQGSPTFGNVWEGGDCSKRVARSSSYRTSDKELRVTKRYSYGPLTRLETLGFRVMRVD